MKALKHFRTITKHRHKVIRNCMKAGIGFQGLFHDLSKYTPTEFLTGAKHYLGTRSPNEQERSLYGYSKAWLHHKGRNRHHFEYWTDYDPVTHLLTPCKMPYNYVAEMFCDRMAASKIYRGSEYRDCDPLNYFLKSKATRFIHPKTSDEIEELLTMLRDKGEDETFRYLRKKVKEYKHANKH